MFESLSEKLGNVFRKLGEKGILTEKDIDEALRQVRIALLEADVNFKVVKNFLAKVKERSLGTEVMKSLTPDQQIVKIVNEELIAILGKGKHTLEYAKQPPTVILLVGLQGSGKTTTAAKLARHLRREGHRPLLVAADPYRPAAVAQLEVLGKELNISVYNKGDSVVETCVGALNRAEEVLADVVIIDTAGRLQVEEELMDELVEVKNSTHPAEILLVADAMTGQEAVKIADEFHKKVGLTGIVLTKMDGDARGGAALSITSVTSIPVKFIGVGEKSNALEPFYPDRLASRILGMGDVLTFIEKVEEAVSEEKALELEKKIRFSDFNLEDFLEQLQGIKKMGSIRDLAEMIPGLTNFSNQIPDDVDEKRLKRIEAMIFSMTPKERCNPRIIDGSRRRRIAKGSGTTIQDVNQLLNQFRQMQKFMKQMSKGKGSKLLSFLK